MRSMTCTVGVVGTEGGERFMGQASNTKLVFYLVKRRLADRLPSVPRR
jgi:hypothetical protein